MSETMLETARYTETDLRANDDQECFVRLYLASGAKQDYIDCYAVMLPDGRTLVRSHQDPLNVDPRAVFNKEVVLYFEHYGEVLHESRTPPPAPRRNSAEPLPVKALQKPSEDALDPELRQAVETFGKPSGAKQDDPAPKDLSAQSSDSDRDGSEESPSSSSPARVVRIDKGHSHKRPSSPLKRVGGSALSLMLLAFGSLHSHR